MLINPNDLDHALRTAAAFRESHPHMARSGVVVIDQRGEAIVWTSELRNSTDWPRGSVAVDTRDSIWIATGGVASETREWVKIHEAPGSRQGTDSKIEATDHAN